MRLVPVYRSSWKLHTHIHTNAGHLCKEPFTMTIFPNEFTLHSNGVCACQRGWSWHTVDPINCHECHAQTNEGMNFRCESHGSNVRCSQLIIWNKLSNLRCSNIHCECTWNSRRYHPWVWWISFQFSRTLPLHLGCRSVWWEKNLSHGCHDPHIYHHCTFSLMVCA